MISEKNQRVSKKSNCFGLNLLQLYPDKIVETDSDSIETISDDEILVAQSHAYCYIPGV